MIEILHHLTYIDMYYTTRLPILLVYEVDIRSGRVSTIHSSIAMSIEIFLV